MKYIRSHRLDKVAGLKSKGNMTIVGIAYQVGFVIPNYFARSNRDKFNMLPSEFNARMKKENPDNNNNN